MTIAENKYGEILSAPDLQGKITSSIKNTKYIKLLPNIPLIDLQEHNDLCKNSILDNYNHYCNFSLWGFCLFNCESDNPKSGNT